MTEFFAINVDKFIGPDQKQLQVFGATIDNKMQIAWAAPAMKLVTMLRGPAFHNSYGHISLQRHCCRGQGISGLL